MNVSLANITAAQHHAQYPALRRGRALHLVDLENLIGTGSPTTEQVAAAWAAYQAVVQDGDQVVVACSQHAALAVWFTIGRAARLLARRGPDGADRALLDAIDLVHTADRFAWLVVASGDHIFAPLVLRARLHGLTTWQVTGTGHSARVLTRAAQLHSQMRPAGRTGTRAVALAA